VLSTLQTLAWLVCVIYATIPSFWLLIHSRAEYWRSRPRSPYLILLPLWVAMWIVLGLITAPWRRLSLYSTGWAWIPAALLFTIGLRIYQLSGKHFSGAQLGGLPEVQSGHREQRLVTAGIRQRVRHPVYLAHLCEMLAWSVGSGLVVCYGLTAFAVLTGAVMIRLEDKELEQRFGEEYREYRQKVPAVLPRI
jgi:protein-S-isoprenylcysteine O-methyltransferase Ste14